MYTLFVTNELTANGHGTFSIERKRFLEYTSSSISAQLSSLSVEAMESIRSWPCLLIREGRGQETAFIARITAVDGDGAELQVAISAVAGAPPLTNDSLWKLRTSLDIAEFEFSRNHWAIKDRELFTTLSEAGLTISIGTSTFSNKPLPGPSRAELIRTRATLAEWSHADIDDFLLEAGIADLRAAREVGTRRDRAHAIISYAVEHPAATTAENSLLSAAIVKKAAMQRAGAQAHVAVPGGEVPNAVSSESSDPATQSSRSPNRVFIVHGRDETARTKVVNLLTRIGLAGIILHEQPNMGRHLLTKLIEEAELTTFAIVLMTSDDVGGLVASDMKPRARQNVILELGYFLSHLGQRRVCALKTPGLETPSDFDGIVYISMDDAGHWEQALIRELKAANMPLTS